MSDNIFSLHDKLSAISKLKVIHVRSLLESVHPIAFILLFQCSTVGQVFGESDNDLSQRSDQLTGFSDWSMTCTIKKFDA